MLGMAAAVAGAWASQFVCDEGTWLIAISLFPGLVIGALLAGQLPTTLVWYIHFRSRDNDSDAADGRPTECIRWLSICP